MPAEGHRPRVSAFRKCPSGIVRRERRIAGTRRLPVAAPIIVPRDGSSCPRRRRSLLAYDAVIPEPVVRLRPTSRDVAMYDGAEPSRNDKQSHIHVDDEGAD